jgi:predicted metal-dependent hydrolase
LKRWYESHATNVFRRRLELCLEKAVWVERAPAIQVSWMRQQWGNCTPEGDLNLNVALVRASIRQIDYVISHELCHVAEHNHSPRFYELLGGLLPDWKRIKHQLDERWGWDCYAGTDATYP